MIVVGLNLSSKWIRFWQIYSKLTNFFCCPLISPWIVSALMRLQLGPGQMKQSSFWRTCAAALIALRSLRGCSRSSHSTADPTDKPLTIQADGILISTPFPLNHPPLHAPPTPCQTHSHPPPSPLRRWSRCCLLNGNYPSDVSAWLEIDGSQKEQ